MSGQRFSRATEITHLVAEVTRLSVEENLETYGIELDRMGLNHSDEFVYDTLYDKYFKTIHEWAAFTVDQESSEYDDLDDKYSKHNDEDTR